MSTSDLSLRVALLSGIAAARQALHSDWLKERLGNSGVPANQIDNVIEQLQREGRLRSTPTGLELTSSGVIELLNLHVQIQQALDPSDAPVTAESCPSVPWLTTVQTVWLDAISLNYAVDPAALSGMLPAPLEPEVFHGTAWVQVLMSSLQDMRPAGAPSLFGVRFCQVSYRAAVRYRGADGAWRRGGYFIRSETNHPVMQAVGNTLIEFRFFSVQNRFLDL